MDRLLHIAVCIPLIATTLVCSLLLPREAACRLTGEADLGYVDFKSSDDKGQNSAHSFTQRYSVLYETSGKFVSGRVGRYNAALGYEWLAFDSNEKSSAAPSKNSSESKGHLFYRGEMVVDPKEIPLRLRIYSMDMNRNSFGTEFSNQEQLLSAASSEYRSIASNVTTDINGGTRIDSGVTLVAGVKNGMTNGYNEVLRHFPMLMLDYRDQINKDSGGLTPVNNRLTRLAFVSLNKKDNWFHYRYMTYKDYIDNSNDYNESQLQLGTVDHTLQRRWIDFSNWLSVSADGQLTKRMNVESEENFEEFALNLFGTARRRFWELRTFNSFTRYNEINRDRLTYMTSVPVYASGVFSPAVSWNAYTKYNNNHTDKGAAFTTVNGGYTVDAFRKSPFTLSQGLGVEHVTNDGITDALLLTGTVGTASTPLYSRKLSLKATYNVRSTRSENINGSSNFIEHEFRGTAGYNLSNRLRITADQTNRFTSGTAQRILSDIPGAVVNTAQYQTPRAGVSSGGSSYQSMTGLKIDWIPKPRLKIGFSALEDIFAPADGERSIVTTLNASASYTGASLKISSIASYNSGNSGNSDNAAISGGGAVEKKLSSMNRVSYDFSRNLNAGASITFVRTFGADRYIDTFDVAQHLNYYYQASGTGRKLFEISESFTSVEEGVTSSLSQELVKRRTNTSLLGVKYYPLRNMVLAGGARYSFANGSENSSINYYSSISVNYQLLQASLDYTYGKNKVDNRVEKRVMANIKKKF